MNSTTKADRDAVLRQAIQLKKAAAARRASDLPRRPESRPAELGPLQRGIWLESELHPRSAAYHLASAFFVRQHDRQSGAELDLARLEAAFGTVLARHRILRSTFRLRRGRVLQDIASDLHVEIERLNASPGELEATAAAACRRPFDLERGPLVRLLLVEEPGDRPPLLVLLLHHLLADERSLELLWSEIAACYRGDAEPATEAERPQYDDFVDWTRNRPRAREENQRDLDFWRGVLEPPPRDIELAFEPSVAPENIEPENVEPNGRLVERQLPDRLGAEIRTLASANQVTPFAVYAFAFRLLLDRLQDEPDVAFGVPATVRSHPATNDMIGYFLNPVVIRATVDPSHRLDEGLAAFDATMREALAHAQVPFDRLVEELDPERHLERTPWFRTFFVVRQPIAPIDLGDVRLEACQLDLGAPKFDLTLFVEDGKPQHESLRVALEYRRDRLSQQRAGQLITHYTTLLESLVEQPRGPVTRLEVLSPHERDAVTERWQGATLDPRSERSLLPRQILSTARAQAPRPALVQGDEQWSYRELAEHAMRIALELGARGVNPGERVGIFLDRSPMAIAAIVGCQWAGAAYVPLDPDYPAERTRRVLLDAEVACVLTEQMLRERLPQQIEQEFELVLVEQLRQSPSSGSNGPTASDELPALERLQPEHLAYVLYTSGSTGAPKGVMVRHANLLASTTARTQFYEVAPRRFLLLPSLAFDSSVAGIFWMLSSGGALVIPDTEEARDARRLVDLIERQRVDGLLCVPSLYAQMLRFAAPAQSSDDHPLASLRTVIVAGESCPAALVTEHHRRLAGARLFNEYGPTEATVWATVAELRDPEPSAPVSIGRPIPGARVTLHDRHGNLVPPGVRGEAWIEGSMVAEGYWRRPELTAERFEGQRYRTGDLLSWTDRGELLFWGRADQQIKLRGQRIEPEEIEATLLQLEDIEEAAVVLHPGSHGSTGPALVAFVRSPMLDEISESALERWREHLARQLPTAMVPARFELLDAMPRLANGKLDREALSRCKLTSEAPRSAAGFDVLRSTDREQNLLALWQGLLGVPRIAVDDNFFELGGHSLLAVELVDAIERDHGVALSPAQVFAHPTVRQIARLLDQESPTVACDRHLYAIQPHGDGDPLIFAIPHELTHPLAERFRGERPVYGLRGIGLRHDGNLGRWRSMEQLAAEAADEIARRFPDQTVILGGYSFGASMAAALGSLLERRGTPARHLFLIAPMPLEFLGFGPFDLRLPGLDRPAEELGRTRALARWIAAHHPFQRRTYQMLHHALVVAPWRRSLQTLGKLRRRLGLPLTERILWADVRVDRFRLHAAYRPRPQSTPTSIFNPLQQEGDAAATWRSAFRGPLDVVPTPDPHDGDDATTQAAQRFFARWREVMQENGDSGEISSEVEPENGSGMSS